MSPAIPGARKPGTFLFSLRAAISADDVRHVPPSSDAERPRRGPRSPECRKDHGKARLEAASRSRRGNAKPRRAAACRTVQRLVFGTHSRRPAGPQVRRESRRCSGCGRCRSPTRPVLRCVWATTSMRESAFRRVTACVWSVWRAMPVAPRQPANGRRYCPTAGCSMAQAPLAGHNDARHL